MRIRSHFVEALAPRVRLGARAFGAGEGVVEHKDEEHHLHRKEVVQVPRLHEVDDGLDGLVRDGAPRLAWHPGEHLDSLHERRPEEHTHQRVDNHLALHPDADAPYILLDGAIDEPRLGRHVQDEGGQLAAAARVVGAEDTLPTVKGADRAPDRHARRDRAPRRGG